jgi:putative drug exporter of the RND superfamily
LHDGTGRLSRLVGRYAVLIVGLWILTAGVANLAVPQLERVVDSHARTFMPTDAPSSIAATHAAQLFGQIPSNNFIYVVLERDQRLTPSSCAHSSCPPWSRC